MLLTVPDAALTPLGTRQAAALAPKLARYAKEIDLIVTSPLKRTLETTLLGWQPAIEKLGIENVIVHPASQECNNLPCDIGSQREVLQKMSEFVGLNFSSLTPDWTSKQGFWAADAKAISNRARSVRHFLKSRPEKNIVLVSHGDFLRKLTAGVDSPNHYSWNNAEVRIFKFDPASIDSDDSFLLFDEEIEGAGGYSRGVTGVDDLPDVDTGAVSFDADEPQGLQNSR